MLMSCYERRCTSTKRSSRNASAGLQIEIIPQSSLEASHYFHCQFEILMGAASNLSFSYKHTSPLFSIYIWMTYFPQSAHHKHTCMPQSSDPSLHTTTQFTETGLSFPITGGVRDTAESVFAQSTLERTHLSHTSGGERTVCVHTEHNRVPV